MLKKLLLYSIALITIERSAAQELITGLSSNRLVKSEWERTGRLKGISINDTIDLPFFDDFSGSSVYPVQTLWSDKYVFINNTFSVKQRSAGIATFDALDQDGRLYETATSNVFAADVLTSRPINMSYPASDDIYMSFFYESGGTGDQPEERDSLSLSFYSPSDSKWYSVWKAPGNTTNGFKAVILKIQNSRFLRKGFRFRFSNYASLSSATTDPSMAGSSDNWNIDYVRIGRFRNQSDTIPADVAFTLPVRSVLKTHEAMPLKHFKQVFLSEMGPFITINYRNNDAIVRNVTRNFEIKDVYKGTLVHDFSAGATNIEPATNINYKATLLYTFSTDNPDSALFLVKGFLTTDAFDYKKNDTITYYQRFGRYFAYDDGSAEGGYGINGLGSRNAMVACRYRSYILDTLRAVSISFNDSYLNSNQRAFTLMVWDDEDGTPGTVLYSGEDEVVIPGNAVSGFHTYVLKTPVPIFGDFHVGWKQVTETYLNAGFDANTPNSGHLKYWLNGNWFNSQAPGTVMIRPVFGPPINTVGINDNETARKELRFWPNPASDIINIQSGLDQPGQYTEILIYDLQGRQVMKTEYSESIDVSRLGSGIYFMRIISGKRLTGTGKFIISKR
ncbi:MAG: T9SS type A sorting domain-containing protein [Bacteroidales bacterium]